MAEPEGQPPKEGATTACLGPLRLPLRPYLREDVLLVIRLVLQLRAGGGRAGAGGAPAAHSQQRRGAAPQQPPEPRHGRTHAAASGRRQASQAWGGHGRGAAAAAIPLLSPRLASKAGPPRWGGGAGLETALLPAWRRGGPAGGTALLRGLLLLASALALFQPQAGRDAAADAGKGREIGAPCL